jgi:hypothetical protein
VPDATAIGGVVLTLDETTGDEPVNDSGDARSTDRELLGKRRGRLSTLPQDCEHAVLRECQIDSRNRQLELACEAHEHSARALR